MGYTVKDLGENIAFDGGDDDFIVLSKTATLNGQTRVALTTPLNRVSRLYNGGSTNLAGNVYVYRDTTISAGYLSKSGSNSADCELEIRESGFVFRVSDSIVIATGRGRERENHPILIARPNSDIRMTVVASASAQEIKANISGYLAIIIGTTP